MAWEEDSISRLEDSLTAAYASFANSSNGGDNDTSDLSSEDEKFEASSVRRKNGSSRQSSDAGKRERRGSEADSCRSSWWRFGAREERRRSSCNISWGDDEEEPEQQQQSNDILVQTTTVDLPDEAPDPNNDSEHGEERPSWWWRNTFRRKNVSSSEWSSSANSSKLRNSFIGARASEDEVTTAQHSSTSSIQPAEEDAELDRLLFPRRGQASLPQSTLARSRRATIDSQDSAPKFRGSFVKQASTGSVSVSSNNASVATSYKSTLDASQASMDQVLVRHSMNLGSVERALLADLVQPHQNRWKPKPHKQSSEGLSRSIPEEDDNSLNSNRSDKDNPTAETMIETQMSPQSDLLKPLDMGESLSSEDADEDGLYCSWSVGKNDDDDDQDATPNINNQQQQQELPDTLPPLQANWDTEQLLSIKNSVSLSRTHVIDDVSSIASSEHSGRIVTAKSQQTSRLSYRRKQDGNKLSILTSMRGIKSNNKGLSTRAQNLLAGECHEEEEEEEEDLTLEQEMFAIADAKHAKVVKEAMGLMDSVNKSVVSMGMEAPFRNMDEICPPFKKLHKNILYQLHELNAVISSDQIKLLRKSTESNKRQSHHRHSKSAKTKGLDRSFTSNTSDFTGTTSEITPDLHDRKAVASYIMNRITHETSTPSVVSKAKTIADAKTHTAYLPNFMYYQFIAADPSTVIKPTSLCSGTGITGGDQYLKPDMLNMFGMFGSYFAGAGHLFQECDSEEDGERPRRSTFYMEPIHEGESLASSTTSIGHFSSASGSDDELLVSSEQSGMLNASPLLSVELLESIIDDLKRGQLGGMQRNTGAVPPCPMPMPSYIMSPENGLRNSLSDVDDDVSFPNQSEIDEWKKARMAEKTEKCDSGRLPRVPVSNSSNLPDRNVIEELKRGQMKEIPNFGFEKTHKQVTRLNEGNLLDDDGGIRKMRNHHMGYY